MGKKRKRRGKRKSLLTALERDIALLDAHRFENAELEDMRGNLIRQFITRAYLTDRQKQAAHRMARAIRAENRQVRTEPKKPKIYYVYAIHDGASIKVGYTCDIDKRLKALQTSNASELTLEAKIRCGKLVAAKRLEKQIHKHGKEWHIRGEWFHEDVMSLFDKFGESANPAGASA